MYLGITSFCQRLRLPSRAIKSALRVNPDHVISLQQILCEGVTNKNKVVLVGFVHGNFVCKTWYYV